MNASTTANGTFHALDSSKPPSPASPTSSFQNQQPVASRSFISLSSNAGTSRTQNAAHSLTSNLSHINTLESPAGMAYGDYIRTWTDAHVARWLTDIKCGSHASTFKSNDIRGDILLELDQLTLKEMGVSSIGDRLRIVNAVKALRQKASSRNAASSSPEVQRPGRLSTEHSDPRGATGDSGNMLANAQDRSESSPTSRLGSRRLESGRPAPLQLNSSPNRNDLPRLVREPSFDFARVNHNHIRPLPQPTQTLAAASTPASSTPVSSTHSIGSRANLPPLPPPPRSQPPLPPPNRPPPRPFLNGGSQLGGRRTPTQIDVPAYTVQPLPPAPQNQALLTPMSASNWAGQHLPLDPRPGNAGGKTPTRSTSPLPSRGGPRTPTSSNSHGRNISLGVNSPSSSSTSVAKLPPRAATASGISHPYANAQPALQPPASQPGYNLSPIAESFMTQHSSNSGSPSPPINAYTVGRGPFNSNTPSHGTAPSLDDLRRKLVKFLLPGEGHSCVINVADCAGGVEVLEKVLKKFDKGGLRGADGDGDHVQTESGGLCVDGWGVYMDWGQDDGLGEPLTEAELMSVCHAPPDHPAREHGLTIRKITKLKRVEERSNSLLSPTVAKSSVSAADQPGKNTKRASSVIILSSLGVRNPEKALDPPSPTHAEEESPTLRIPEKKPSKLRNFFGQRPPSELITTHLTEYFPFTEKKVLERTARNSMMMRSNTVSSGKRDSTISWNPSLPSRFSSSTQGSQGRDSISPSRASISSYGPPLPLAEKLPAEDSPTEDVPRVSVSTEDGRDVDIDEETLPTPVAHAPPQLLPPIPFPTESFSESLESITGGLGASRPASRTMSISSKRMSYMTELRSKRDRSDTASMMTVDEITAEVESRRETLSVSDSEDWTKVDSDEGLDSDSLSATLADEEESGSDDESVEEELEEVAETPVNIGENDDTEDETGTTTRVATKWIKGALIGAGSFGKVYLGMDASNGLLMAVKQVELPTGSAPNQERKKSMLSALEREIELLKDLQHDNIVQYLYSSLDDEFLNIFLEYVPGGSVTALLRNYGAFEEPLVKNFVRQILEGLNYLHERDIIHRDIKGANILVDNKGGIKISDFGISKKVEDNLLTGNRVHRPSLQGSVFWMAPEVVKQTGHTRKADIWSVGCLVVEMLTGEHPWAQLTQMQAIFKIGSMAKPAIPSDISAEAQDFLLRTFEIDHEARPSAGELLQHPWICKKVVTGSKGNAPKVIEISA